LYDCSNLKTTFIYWPIESILKFSFVEVWQLEITNFMYWPIECNTKALFVWMSQLERTTYIYWSIECTPNLYL
jgi:hypothetical protein